MLTMIMVQDVVFCDKKKIEGIEGIQAPLDHQPGSSTVEFYDNVTLW